MKKHLIIEPYYSGSHKAMIDILLPELQHYLLITTSGKKWPWRARCSALVMSMKIPEDLSEYGTLFCSSVLNLAELVGLRPQLAGLKKIVYFHENQLIYPVQAVKERDFQYGYNQITTCLAADIILFNSQFNMDSFLSNIDKFLKIMPDNRTKGLASLIRPKCHVAYFPVDFSMIDNIAQNIDETSETLLESTRKLHLVWPHRWEFDKNPDLLFETLIRLKNDGIDFEVSVMGECFSEVPQCFLDSAIELKDHIKNIGYVPTKMEYYKILLSADIVISTADHEFFGVSVMEAVRAGCFPLVPNKLVYPELYPKICLYDTKDELFKLLKKYCLNCDILKKHKDVVKNIPELYDARILSKKIIEILNS